MKLILNALLLALLLCWVASCNNSDVSSPGNTVASTEDHIAAPVLVTHQVLNRYPHDTLSFTEGFTFFKGQLFESTGSPDEMTTNNSWAGPLNLQTGTFQRKVDLGKRYFGEGITFLNDKLYQLTWRSKIGFIYDARTFKKLRSFNYASDGWGLTNDGKYLIMSTGSSNLYYLDPDSLSFLKMLPVQDNNGYKIQHQRARIHRRLYLCQSMADSIHSQDRSEDRLCGRQARPVGYCE